MFSEYPLKILFEPAGNQSLRDHHEPLPFAFPIACCQLHHHRMRQYVQNIQPYLQHTSVFHYVFIQGRFSKLVNIGLLVHQEHLLLSLADVGFFSLFFHEGLD
jgi:hypothetical protein